MALNIRRSRAAVVALTAAMAVVSLGPAFPAVAAGYTATAGPWSTPVALTGAGGRQSLIDVKVAGDGTAFALWRDQAADAATWELRVAVKPAESGTWTPAHTLLTDTGKNAEALLAVTADGHGVVTWRTGDGTDVVAVAATWDPAAGQWSDPATLATWHGLDMSTPRLAAAADGTLTAVWDQGDGLRNYQLMASTRAPGAQAWSAPKPLGSVSTASVQDIALAVAPDGAATAGWEEYDQFTGERIIRTSTRPSANGTWSGAAVLPGSGSPSGDVQVTMDAKDSTTVMWGNGGDLKSTTRTSPTGSWSAPQIAVADIEDGDNSGPLTAPNGDITYVWTHWSAGAGTPIVQAVTRTAGTRTWSAPKTLSTGYVEGQVSASIGADGTVHVVWPQTPSINNGNDHYLQWAVRVNGTWSKAATLDSTPVADVPDDDALTGEVAAGPDGRATVVWRKATYESSGRTSQMWAQSQTLLAKPQITAKAAVSGTARAGSRLTCSAAWSGYHATAAWSWLRDGKVVSGATGKTWTLTSADYQHKVACRITVGNGAGSVNSTSPALAVTVGPALKATAVPSVRGTAKVGYKLTAVHGTWSPAATSYSYRWKRNGASISGATKSTYVAAKADRGKKITVTVIAHRTGWTSGSATTRPVTVR
ncbi:hypothetical protein ACFYXS_20060 [Streptomyces sp. NPDC002574]|uniref:hypothetical protein n=1 Tax=Streptomyces sp. NPDC002574 TaxID=3364652 RepID=UPI0036B31F57